jgi:hypothetical protein
MNGRQRLLFIGGFRSRPVMLMHPSPIPENHESSSSERTCLYGFSSHATSESGRLDGFRPSLARMAGRSGTRSSACAAVGA